MKAFLESAMLSFFQFIGDMSSKFFGWITNTVLPAFGEGLMKLFTNLIGAMVGEKGLNTALFTNAMVLSLVGFLTGVYMFGAIGFLLWIGFVIRMFDKKGDS